MQSGASRRARLGEQPGRRYLTPPPRSRGSTSACRRTVQAGRRIADQPLPGTVCPSCRGRLFRLIGGDAHGGRSVDVRLGGGRRIALAGAAQRRGQGSGAEAGVHAKVESERLGHGSIGIKLDTCSHMMPGTQEDAAERIDAGLRLRWRAEGRDPRAEKSSAGVLRLHVVVRRGLLLRSPGGVRHTARVRDH
jgi:hypothetical protein